MGGRCPEEGLKKLKYAMCSQWKGKKICMKEPIGREGKCPQKGLHRKEAVYSGQLSG
jgi:hypothetical protein